MCSWQNLELRWSFWVDLFKTCWSVTHWQYSWSGHDFCRILSSSALQYFGLSHFKISRTFFATCWKIKSQHIYFSPNNFLPNSKIAFLPNGIPSFLPNYQILLLFAKSDIDFFCQNVLEICTIGFPTAPQECISNLRIHHCWVWVWFLPVWKIKLAFGNLAKSD